MSIILIHGDCREHLIQYGPFDVIFADPPYGDTSLAWDKKVAGWEKIAADALAPNGSLWVFGSLRFLASTWQNFEHAGLRYAQDVVWEKQNGSNFHADRFRRVHEHAVQFYHRSTAWSDVYKDVQTTPDAVAKQVRRKKKPKHYHHGAINEGEYVSVDGGPRLMTSVIYARNCHGFAIHETQKPVALLEPLIRYSCPEGGKVGDMFAGSAAVGDACALLNRQYVGCEINDGYYAAASGRLSASLFGSIK